MDLTMSFAMDDEPEDAGSGASHVGDIGIQITSAKSRPVTLELRQAQSEELETAKVVRASERTTRKNGEYTWRIEVAPHATSKFSYRLKVEDPDK